MVEPSTLTTKHIEQFDEQGFCIVESALDSRLIKTLKSRAAEIVKCADIPNLTEVFSTASQRRVSNDYFLDSAETVCCFLEEKALFDKQKLRETPELCVNKIGHALHVLDPVFSPICVQSAWGTIAETLGIEYPELRQSMYIFKQPSIGGEVCWHQDASFFFTTPQSVLAFWFALDDATVENGCLWVQPSGHRSPIREQFCLRNDNGQRHTEMITLDTTPWPNMAQARAVEVNAGTLVLMHGCLPHYSAPNHSALPRQAFTLHVTDAAARYSESNWLQPQKRPPAKFLK